MIRHWPIFVATFAGSLGTSWLRPAIEALPASAMSPTQFQGVINLAPDVRILPVAPAAIGVEVRIQAVGVDPDPGDSVFYRWLQIQGPPVSAIGGWTNSYLRFVPAEAGAYLFRVYIRDYHGGVAVTEISVDVPIGFSAGGTN